MTIGVGSAGLGTVLSVDPAGGSSWSTVGIVISGLDNAATAEVIDTSLLGDTWKSSVPGQLDPGNLDLEIVLDNSDTMNGTLYTIFSGRTIATWKITYPDSAVEDSFAGYITSYGRTVETNSMNKRKLSIQITGDAGFMEGSGL